MNSTPPATAGVSLSGDTPAAAGFVEVISPVASPEEIWLLTFWADEASFRTWHHSHLYHAAVARRIVHQMRLRAKRRLHLGGHAIGDDEFAQCAGS